MHRRSRRRRARQIESVAVCAPDVTVRTYPQFEVSTVPTMPIESISTASSTRHCGLRAGPLNRTSTAQFVRGGSGGGAWTGVDCCVEFDGSIASSDEIAK
jgi:hypothetical protein